MPKYAALGTILKRVATPIVGIKSISGPGMKADTDDTTTHDSTGGWEEAVVTILRSGEVKIELLYDPAAATHKNAAGGLIADFIARTATAYSLVFPDIAATTWTFNAFVTAFEPSAPVEGKLSATATLKLTGQPTLA
jgi:predicted secreted protein